MRKVNGRWRFVEYELSGSRYTVLAQGQLCVVLPRAGEGDRLRLHEALSATQLLTRRKASIARSRCSGSSAADIWTRIRAVPSGTTGNPKPVTKTPSSRSRSDSAIAVEVSPTMIGMIAASPSSGA